jgi:hypothetical protein
LAAKDYEIARAKAASCIRDELLCEAYAILEVLLSQCKQRLDLLNMYRYDTQVFSRKCCVCVSVNQSLFA